MELEAAFELYGLAAIFVVMLLKAAGVPLPVPADLIMLVTAAQAAEGRLSLGQAFAVILVALVLGGVVQFSLARGPARQLLYRSGRYLGLTPARLDAAAGAIQRGGVAGIGLAILTPGLRAAAVAASGLAGVPLRTFLPGLVLGSSAFLALHFGLGYAGSQIIVTLGRLPAPMLVLVAGGLLAAGFGAWWAIRRRQQPAVETPDLAADAFEAWHEATCPVCLVLGATLPAGAITPRPTRPAALPARE